MIANLSNLYKLFPEDKKSLTILYYIFKHSADRATYYAFVAITHLIYNICLNICVKVLKFSNTYSRHPFIGFVVRSSSETPYRPMHASAHAVTNSQHMKNTRMGRTNTVSNAVWKGKIFSVELLWNFALYY